jgi:aminoglycoside 3-N-acetyltransferase
MSKALEKLKAGRAKYGLARYLNREAKQLVDKVFYRLDKRALCKAFTAIGVRGKTICAHSSLSGLGYIVGGADTVIDALLDSVGTEGCVMMPAFSMTGTMQKYVGSGAVFDARTTPSRTGAVTEKFRQRAGVLRSLHPTNSLAACGRGAQELLAGHEQSLTPYGFATPYGRLVENPDAFILMLDTHVQSLLHHVQERVEFPNLFLDGEAQVRLVDAQGAERTMTTKVMRPMLPYFVAVPGVSGPPDWVTLHDFALMFPPYRRRLAAEAGYRPETIGMLEDRRRQFVSKGILKTARLGRTTMGLLNVAQFVREVQPYFEKSISTFRQYYDVSYLESQRLRLF